MSRVLLLYVLYMYLEICVACFSEDCCAWFCGLITMHFRDVV